MEEYYNYKKFLDFVAEKSHHFDGINSQSDNKENAHPNIEKKKLALGEKIVTSQQEISQVKSSGNIDKISKDIYEKLRVNKNIIDLIEDDSTQYKLKFNSPEDLLKHFTYLEEKNLFLIQQTQEAEQAIEDKIIEFELEKK